MKYHMRGRCQGRRSSGKLEGVCLPGLVFCYGNLLDFSETVHNELINRSENPDEVVLDMEKRKAILAAIESLNTTERNLLIMKYNLDLSNREIGKILKMKPNTVKVGLYRARKKFKAAYQKLKEVKL